MAWLYKRPGSPFWWVAWVAGGRKSRQSTGIRHEERKRPGESALAIQRNLEERLARARFGLSAMVREKTISSLVTDYMVSVVARPRTIDRYQQLANNLVRWMEGQKVATVQEVSHELVARYVADGLKERADCTVRQECAFFRRMWVEARKRDFCAFDQNPWDVSIKCEQRARQPYTDDELQAIFAATKLPQWMRVCCWLALYTGARCDTLRGLHTEHIGLDMGVINFHRSKTDPYSVPLHPVLAEYLRSLKLPPGPIMPPEAVEGNAYFAQLFARCTAPPKEKGGAGFRGQFHRFRHTFNTRLMECGVPRTAAMFLMNHKSESSNAKYTHVEAIAMAPQLAKLEYGVKIA